MLRGDDVREFRERHRLTQYRLAVLLDVNPQTVSRWEREQLPRSRLLELALHGLDDELRERAEQQA